MRGMKKLAITIGSGVVAVAYVILIVFLVSHMFDRGGWWIPSGVAAILLNIAVMRYLGESAFEVDGGFPADFTEDGDNQAD